MDQNNSWALNIRMWSEQRIKFFECVLVSLICQYHDTAAYRTSYSLINVLSCVLFVSVQQLFEQDYYRELVSWKLQLHLFVGLVLCNSVRWMHDDFMAWETSRDIGPLWGESADHPFSLVLMWFFAANLNWLLNNQWSYGWCDIKRNSCNATVTLILWNIANGFHKTDNISQ